MPTTRRATSRTTRRRRAERPADPRRDAAEGARAFRSWMDGEGLSLRGAAVRLNVSRGTIANWRAARATPTPAMRVVISRESGGRVPPPVWLTDDERAALRAEAARLLAEAGAGQKTAAAAASGNSRGGGG